MDKQVKHEWTLSSVELIIMTQISILMDSTPEVMTYPQNGHKGNFCWDNYSVDMQLGKKIIVHDATALNDKQRLMLLGICANAHWSLTSCFPCDCDNEEKIDG